MKKMIVVYILLIIACIVGTAAIVKTAADDKLADTRITMQAAIDKEKVNYVKLDEFCGSLAKENAALRDENTRLADELEILNDIIVRMRTVPEAAKLLKERLPHGPTNTLRFMDYRTITDTASLQYKLQQECETSIVEGIRIYSDGEKSYYCVALGSAYGQDIGDTWHVTLECGTEFDIILAECKDDGTTDYFGDPDENYDGQDCMNVIEFVVDEDKIPLAAMTKGTFTVLYGGLCGTGGNIVKMEYTGKVWET